MSFNLPNVASYKQIPVLVNIIEKQRQELVPLRAGSKHYQTEISHLGQELQIWKDKYQKIKEERDQFKKGAGTW